MAEHYAGGIPVATAMPIGAPSAPRLPPQSLRSFSLPPPPGDPSLEGAVREFLTANTWPEGLQEYFLRRLRTDAATYFIVDDSGSMSISDATRFVKHGTKMVPVTCSRYAELQDCITFHASLANTSKHPTTFRLLNNAPPIVIGGPADDGSGYGRLLQALELSPGGGTPLCQHIREVVAEIASMASALRADGRKVTLVITTDGEANDGSLAEAMEPLKDLPVWVVLRLCTDEAAVVDYWAGIDQVLELNIDVLDDLGSEAAEVRKVNPWLLYGEPLHRLREVSVLRATIS